MTKKVKRYYRRCKIGDKTIEIRRGPLDNLDSIPLHQTEEAGWPPNWEALYEQFDIQPRGRNWSSTPYSTDGESTRPRISAHSAFLRRGQCDETDSPSIHDVERIVS